MAKLNDDIRRLIVTELAMYATPTEAAQAVEEKFGIKIERQQAYDYDPSGAHGHKVAKKWRALFEATRENFRKDASAIPIANKNYRLRRLHTMQGKAETMGNLVLASSLLEQAAKEVGGSFTNRRELTGKDGKDLPAASAVVVLPQKEFIEGGEGGGNSAEDSRRQAGKAS